MSALSVIRRQMRFLLKRRFVQNVVTLQVGSVFANGLGVLKSIAFARLLGLDGFGTYAVALAFIGTLKLFTGLGQEQALLTYLAEEYNRKDQSGMRGVLRYYLLISILAGGLLLTFAVLSPALTALIYQEHAGTVGQLAMVGFFAYIMSLPVPLVSSLLQIVDRVRLMTVLENADLLMQLLLGVLFIVLGFGPLGIFLGLLCSNTLMSIVYIGLFVALRKRYGLPGLWESLRSNAPISSYVSQGIAIAIEKNVINFHPNALQFLLSLFVTPATVGIVQLAIKISKLPQGLLLGQAARMSQSVLPAVAKEGVTTLRRHCVLLIKHALLGHALLVFGLMAITPFAVIIAYGWEFAAVITPTLWILLIRLLQPFNIANVALLRLYRKVHISMVWNVTRIPIELGIFFLLLRSDIVSPLMAVVIAVLLHQLGAFAMNWYVYCRLLHISPRIGRKHAAN